jgi:hypothetical protein
MEYVMENYICFIIKSDNNHNNLSFHAVRSKEDIFSGINDILS